MNLNYFWRMIYTGKSLEASEKHFQSNFIWNNFYYFKWKLQVNKAILPPPPLCFSCWNIFSFGFHSRTKGFRHSASQLLFVINYQDIIDTHWKILKQHNTGKLRMAGKDAQQLSSLPSPPGVIINNSCLCSRMFLYTCTCTHTQFLHKRDRSP